MEKFNKLATFLEELVTDKTVYKTLRLKTTILKKIKMQQI